MTDKEQYMKEAVNAALKGMNNNEGGPFGCVVVKDGKIVGRGNNQVDAANIGFDDEFIYKEIPLPYSERSIPFEQLAREIALEPFQEWTKKEDKTEY